MCKFRQKFRIKLIFAGLSFLIALVDLGANGVKDIPIPDEELPPGLYARLTTKAGDMMFVLDYEKNRLAVTNFAGLAKGMINNQAKPMGTPFYNGLKFYKVIRGYAAFCGDPEGTGDGGPGYTLPLNPEGLYSAGDSGILAMDGLPRESSGSRFFITIEGDSYLDNKYMRFGKLVYGFKVLRKLKTGTVLQDVEILPIGTEFQFPASAPAPATIPATIYDTVTYNSLLFAERKAEIARLEAMDSDLGNSIKELGENKKKTETGIYYTVLAPGSGPKPVRGSLIDMHYIGSLPNGIIFDSSRNRGQVFTINFGEDGIIPGWIEMISDMQAGETRRVIIPPEQAYGDREFGPIPPNSWLVFEMELVEFTGE